MRSSIRASAFSMAEVLISLVLVSGLLVVSLKTVGGAALARLTISERGIAQELGMALMTEIMDLNYTEPVSTPIFGPEAGEVVVGEPRKYFDDVDDYHNLSETVVEKKGGLPYADRTGWRRTVTVDYVLSSNLTQTSVTDQGFKRITVTVYRNNEVMAKLVAVRSGAVQAILKPVTPIILIPDPVVLEAI